MEIQSTPKRLRALPRVWQRFLYLEIGDGFYIGRCRYVKDGFFHAAAAPSTRRIYLPPWRKVKSDVLVREALPGGKSSCYAVPLPPFPPNMGQTIHDCALRVPTPGQTHYVGDDCPGGHAEVHKEADVHDDVKQPHSVNNITGPSA